MFASDEQRAVHTPPTGMLATAHCGSSAGPSGPGQRAGCQLEHTLDREAAVKSALKIHCGLALRSSRRFQGLQK